MTLNFVSMVIRWTIASAGGNVHEFKLMYNQAVSKTGLAEKIMTLARSGALIFFDRSDAIETGMARTMLSDLVTPAEHSPFHITRIYVQLQVTFEDTEDLFAVLGDLRHRAS